MNRSSFFVIFLSCPVIAVCGCNQAQSTESTPAKAQSAPQAMGTAGSHEAHGDMHHGDMSADEMNMMKVPYSKPPLLARPEALIGARLPAIPLEGTEGESSKLSVVNATPTVLVLWSTWCKACLHETEQITKWVKSRVDVSVLAVNINGIAGEKPDVAKVRSYAHDLGLSGPVWITAADNLSSMGVRTCPTTFIVDTLGVVRAAREGYKDSNEMNQWLDTHLHTL